MNQQSELAQVLVKGLEDRLYGLDQIISGARKIVNQQSELAQVFS